MQPFTTLEGIAVRLPAANIDTDQIVPARFLRHPRKDGYARFLFHDQRFDAEGRPIPDFALNRPENAGATILVAGDNFGCGSSREGAVYALMDYGFRCVVAPSFGDIFRSNCHKNGVLPVVMAAGDIDAICASAPGRPPQLQVNLATQEVQGNDRTVRFEMAAFWKDCLLNGWDDIDITLQSSERIAAFAAERLEHHPWVRPER